MEFLCGVVMRVWTELIMADEFSRIKRVPISLGGRPLRKRRES